MKKITEVLFLLLISMGCNQLSAEVIWGDMQYDFDSIQKKGDPFKGKVQSLERLLIEPNYEKIKNLQKHLNYTLTSFVRKPLQVANVYYLFDTKELSVLSNKVKNIIVTYPNEKGQNEELAHLYISFRKKQKLSDADIKKAAIKKFGAYNETMMPMYISEFLTPLTDIKDMLNEKYGEPFFYNASSDNGSTNDVYDWGMHNNLNYKIVVNTDNKYAYISIKSKWLMENLSEEIIDIKKIQKKQRESSGIIEGPG